MATGCAAVRFGIDEGVSSAHFVLFRPELLIPGTEAAEIADNRFGPSEYVVPEVSLGTPQTAC